MRTATRLLRGASLLAVTAVAGRELWRVHPAGSIPADPDGGIVTGCAWIAWAVAGYLVLAVVLAVLAALADAHALARWTPLLVRRGVELVLSVGLAGALTGTGLAAAAPGVGGSSGIGGAPGSGAAHGPPAAASLDWPGLPRSRAGHSGDGRPDRAGTVSTVTGATVVVQAGESLWTIAARHLGPDPTAEQIAAAWPRWWRANREAIGPDPNLIRPGLHLTVPTSSGSQP